MHALQHDNREEAAYYLGRQPFSYIAIIRWAKANGWDYRIRNRVLWVKCRYKGVGCGTSWQPMRGIT